jgi:glucose/arabinose dehydrogenase
MRPSRLLLPAAALALAATASAQNIRATGKINETYTQLCANCHGQKLEGGTTPGNNKVPSLLTGPFTHGDDDASLAKSIKNGYPEKEMPPWGATLSENDIRSMVIFIREQQFKFKQGQTKIEKLPDSFAGKSQLHDFQLNTWIGDVIEPWSLAFLPGPGNKAIVTEKLGYAYLVDNGKRAARPLLGLPAVDTGGQAGLYDVVAHPDYAKNGWVYFAFSDPKTSGSLTRIIRGKIKGNALIEQETIFQAPTEMYPKAGGVHFGGRLVFDGKGHLFFTIGDRGTAANAQNRAVAMGKVHRIKDDGSLPADNPFAKDDKAFKSIWSYGHRNPQGLAFNAATGELYDLEHGPRGGDEVNLVLPGRNYGWPVISYGMDYPGTPMAGSEGTAKAGMEQPVTFWVPSIAPCGANFYQGDLFPKWKGHLFVATLAAKELRRLELKDGKLVAQEVIFKGETDSNRIRHVIGGPDGSLYVLFRERIARLTPAN